PGLALRGFERKVDFLLACFQLSQDSLAICVQNVSEEVYVRVRAPLLRVESDLGVEIGEENLSAAVCHQQWTIQRVQQARDQLKTHLAARLLFGRHALRRQLALQGSRITGKDTTLLPVERIEWGWSRRAVCSQRE